MLDTVGFRSGDEAPAGPSELGCAGLGAGGTIDGDVKVDGGDATLGGDAGLGAGGATDGGIEVCGGDATLREGTSFGGDWDICAGFLTVGLGAFFDPAFGLLHHLRKKRLKIVLCSSSSGSWAGNLSCQFSLSPPAYNPYGFPLHSIKGKPPLKNRNCNALSSLW
jgi:hypothetical protein